MGTYSLKDELINQNELYEFLNEKSRQYEDPRFLQEDPIQVPHKFHTREDIELSGFLTALIAWGQRKSILSSGHRLMQLMDLDPYRFIMNANERELRSMDGFVHRTFNGEDLRQCIMSLRRIYEQYGGLEGIFIPYRAGENLQPAISALKEIFFRDTHITRTRKHLADPLKGSAAKRLNMFLRWMVRPADRGVDFGLWKEISPSVLSCPLDVHSGRVARRLGLLTRKANDARAVIELDRSLRRIDPIDPVRFDFALFGLGVFEQFR